MKYMLGVGLIDGTCTTVTGKSVEENLCAVPDLDASQNVIMPISSPIRKTGLIQILHGNLAPQGCVAKITGTSKPFIKSRLTVAEVYRACEQLLVLVFNLS